MAEYTVRTIRGPKSFDSNVGYVLPHEHLVCDARVWWQGQGSAYEVDAGPDRWEELTSEQLHSDPQGLSRENLVMADWYLSGVELSKASASGCQLLVDLTCEGVGRDVRSAVKAADLAQVDLVIAVGRYHPKSLKAEEHGRSARSLADEWLSEIENGIDGFLPGIIGEIGMGSDLTEPELRSLEAAAEVQQSSGLAVNVHVNPYARRELEILDLLENAGSDLSRVVISHCDGWIDLPWLKKILKRGCYIEFDTFGTGPNWQIAGRGFSSDEERIEAVLHLVDAGFADQILFSHDINLRSSLTRFGGWGYGHLCENVFPVLEEKIGRHVLQQIVSTNPLRMLSINSLV